MTIKKKIRLSNILMVLIPIGVTALVFGICMQTFLGDYWHSLEVMYRDEKGIQSAQSLIYTYQRELWEVNWGDEVPTQAGNPSARTRKCSTWRKSFPPWDTTLW